MDLSTIDAVHIRRFQARVDSSAGVDECWPWMGTLTVKGYGQLSYGRGASVRAHRLAHYLATGEQPENVCHRCDNPPCCNPSHLFSGTYADNQHDKGAKGRAARGAANGGGGKLTDDDVRAIRRAVDAGGSTQRQIGERYGITGTMVGYIARGRKWAHVQ